MHGFLLVFVLAAALQDSLGVEPGDPFPTNALRPTLEFPGRAYASTETEDPNDDILPGPSVSRKDSSIANETRTSVKSPAKMHVKDDRQPSSKTTTPPPLISISTRNLIKINQWKFEDINAHEIRYWYEPSGGLMGEGWTFDGVAFLAYTRHEPDTIPIYSYHTETAGEWTNTLRTDLVPPAIRRERWIADGISFYAYPSAMNSTLLQPVWRYWSASKDNRLQVNSKRVTFFLINRHSNVSAPPGWIRDRILFYALPFET